MWFHKGKLHQTQRNTKKIFAYFHFQIQLLCLDLLNCIVRSTKCYLFKFQMPLHFNFNSIQDETLIAKNHKKWKSFSENFANLFFLILISIWIDIAQFQFRILIFLEKKSFRSSLTWYFPVLTIPWYVSHTTYAYYIHLTHKSHFH